LKFAAEELIEHAPCGVVEFTDDGTLVAVNTTLLEMLGRERAEVEGQHIAVLFTPGGRMFYETHFYPALRLQNKIEEVHFDLRTAEGGEVAVLAYAVRREHAGRLLNICIFTSTRQRTMYEDELLLAKKSAEKARDEKAKFLSMMSHDLRTPLQAIYSYAAIVSSPRFGTLSPQQKKAAQGIQSAGQEMERMMRDILAYAELEAGSVEARLFPVVVSEALARAESLVLPRMTDLNLQYTVELCDSGLAVLADADRLQHVLLNLLTNAMKFTGRGGSVGVACVQEDSEVAIQVRDSGAGIPEERLEAIFHPFVQVDKERVAGLQRGVGLGLSICRDLTNAMGGRLTVTSEVGVGSVFSIHLPVVG